MKRLRLHLAVVAAIVCHLAPVLAADAAFSLAVRTDRPEAVYRRAEPVEFTVELTGDGQPVDGAEVQCELSTDAFWHSEKRTVVTQDGQAGLTATREEPCVLWLRATYTPAQGPPVQTVAGAAFDPELIRPSMSPPEDFEEFWQGQLARLADVPMNPEVERLPTNVAGVELFRVTLDNINDTKIHGYLAKPPGEGPFPAHLQLQWAGVYSLQTPWVTGPAQRGFLAFNVNAHAIENGRPPEYYSDLDAGELKGYPYQGRESRETCYFLRMYLSCARAADYVASRPEWDGEHFLAVGGSQGGGQAIVTAALSPHVTAVAASVPAMCDHTARAVGRAPGWPMLVATPGGAPDPTQLQVARYFDVVNFARRVRVPALFGTGFADLVCPSSSVYAAYNVYAGPKRMVLDPPAGHMGSHENYWRESWRFTGEQAGLPGSG